MIAADDGNVKITLGQAARAVVYESLRLVASRLSQLQRAARVVVRGVACHTPAVNLFAVHVVEIPDAYDHLEIFLLVEVLEIGIGLFKRVIRDETTQIRKVAAAGRNLPDSVNRLVQGLLNMAMRAFGLAELQGAV